MSTWVRILVGVGLAALLASWAVNKYRVERYFRELDERRIQTGVKPRLWGRKS